MEELSRRERKKLETKAKILKMARKIFEQKGYDNTSIEEISEAVDISKTTVFNYFSSKESILVGLMDEQIELIKNYLVNDLAEVKSPLKKIVLTMKKVYTDSISYIHLNGRILYTSFPKEGNEPSLIQVEYRKIWIGLVEAALAEKELSGKNTAEEIVHMILVCCYGLVTECYSTGDIEAAERKFEIVSEILLRGICIS